MRNGAAAVQDEGSQLVPVPWRWPSWMVRTPAAGWISAPDRVARRRFWALLPHSGARNSTPSNRRLIVLNWSAERGTGLPVEVHVADGRATGLRPGYDRVLVDAPCTGLGALRRRPEARWRRSPDDIADLVRLQRQLLAAAVGLVRPGGVVVYSTCSPHLSETVEITTDALQRFGLEEIPVREVLPQLPELGDGPGAQLWPHRHGTDAMYLAALRKPSD